MAHDYETDREWEIKQVPKVQAILGSLMFRPATFKLDAKQATDFITMSVIGGERNGQKVSQVASRVRRPGFFYDPRGYGLEFTIRSYRSTGAETELAKIKKGYGDWLFYGHMEQEHLRHWMVPDLNVFRAWHAKVSFKEIDNRDGTYGRAYNINDFPTEILIGASDTVKVAMDRGIEAVEELPWVPPWEGKLQPLSTPPDLQELVAKFGGYENITPEGWAAHDAAMAKWESDRRAYLLSNSWERPK